jgi:hypothetical protein
VIGTVYALAWIACPAIEPVPNGPEPSYELWQVPIDLLAIGSIVAACVALWVGSRWGARLGVVAGLGMIAETVTCPGSGHHLVGWYTWVQAALSLAVLASSVALLAFSTPAPGRESYAGR